MQLFFGEVQILKIAYFTFIIVVTINGKKVKIVKKRGFFDFSILGGLGRIKKS